MAKETGLTSPRSPTGKQWDINAVGSEEYLVALTRRIEILEKKLVDKQSLKEDQTPLSTSIKTINKKLTDSLGSANQATVHALWEKIASLERILDPNFVKNIRTGAAVPSAREDLLVSYVDQVKALGEQVEELQQLKDYVNTTEFQGLEAHEKRLATVANIHSQQEQKLEQMTEEAQRLVKVYNEIMLQLSAQCMEWGEELARRESVQ